MASYSFETLDLNVRSNKSNILALYTDLLLYLNQFGIKKISEYKYGKKQFAWIRGIYLVVCTS